MLLRAGEERNLEVPIVAQHLVESHRKRGLPHLHVWVAHLVCARRLYDLAVLAGRKDDVGRRVDNGISSLDRNVLLNVVGIMNPQRAIRASVINVLIATTRCIARRRNHLSIVHTHLICRSLLAVVVTRARNAVRVPVVLTRSSRRVVVVGCAAVEVVADGLRTAPRWVNTAHDRILELLEERHGCVVEPREVERGSIRGIRRRHDEIAPDRDVPGVHPVHKQTLVDEPTATDVDHVDPATARVTGCDRNEFHERRKEVHCRLVVALLALQLRDLSLENLDLGLENLVVLLQDRNPRTERCERLLQRRDLRGLLRLHLPEPVECVRSAAAREGGRCVQSENCDQENERGKLHGNLRRKQGSMNRETLANHPKRKGIGAQTIAYFGHFVNLFESLC